MLLVYTLFVVAFGMRRGEGKVRAECRSIKKVMKKLVAQKVFNFCVHTLYYIFANIAIICGKFTQ